MSMSKVEDEVRTSPEVAHSPISDNLSKKLIVDVLRLSTNFLDNEGENIEVSILGTCYLIACRIWSPRVKENQTLVDIKVNDDHEATKDRF
ncbi:hypothetical protein V6N11_081091 [Hibiscus sabdariffa]|uniref:Uncharacterized protein n=1 Tax=Hibiscus sabdariffa TaxID=183260 RepID=A0ABR2QIT6_9ROSI